MQDPHRKTRNGLVGTIAAVVLMGAAAPANFSSDNLQGELAAITARAPGLVECANCDQDYYKPLNGTNDPAILMHEFGAGGNGLASVGSGSIFALVSTIPARVMRFNYERKVCDSAHYGCHGDIIEGACDDHGGCEEESGLSAIAAAGLRDVGDVRTVLRTAYADERLRLDVVEGAVEVIGCSGLVLARYPLQPKVQASLKLLAAE